MITIRANQHRLASPGANPAIRVAPAHPGTAPRAADHESGITPQRLAADRVIRRAQRYAGDRCGARELKVLVALVNAAARGEPCPSNDRLMELVGLGSPSSAARLVRLWEERGFLRVTRGNRSRVVQVVDTDLRTAGDPAMRAHWREARGRKGGAA